jgi:hypothetical protein
MMSMIGALRLRNWIVHSVVATTTTMLVTANANYAMSMNAFTLFIQTVTFLYSMNSSLSLKSITIYIKDANF